MAKSYNQKGKILYLERILQGTGENHTVSMQEILDELTEQGISAGEKAFMMIWKCSVCLEWISGTNEENQAVIIWQEKQTGRHQQTNREPWTGSVQ